ncbi:two-component regulator propeller domain-containing protein [Draconibacterium sp. IB214405]|uniref:hybrid sensor histidine kinase/response regulator transcription factor n=1 Tax=Draconibacterium sp. IB214405 TaxID=3097352 RepID=UPI002A0B2CD1|nr:two-component regulator propeller domain-containing protein [Draconibacterium sp. IB214405]MDX8341006.1 two-component regulator propeller domain-containing protein [Draconibacterium sp. IB214405]
MRKTYIFSIILLLTCYFATAQNELYFSHLGTEQGFTIDKANTIVQDDNGFIWVGTWNGLNRFDGYDCVTYQPEFHDSTSITNREITKLMVDSKGNLWIGTASGLNCMNLESGKITKIDITKRILSFCEDHNGNIWIGTWSGGLFKLDTETNQLTRYYENEVISDIYEDSRNILWVTTYNGLLKFNPGDETFTRYEYDPNKNSISDNTVTQIVESADGTLWIGTWTGGLNKAIVDENGEITEFISYVEKNKTGDRNKVVYRLFYDQFDNLWIGSWINGLSLLTKDQQQLPPEKAHFWSYYEQVDNPGSISGNNVAAIHVDRNGLLWVGAGTIDLTSIADKGLNRYVLPVRMDEADNRVFVHCFAAYENQLWIGTTYNLLQYEKRNGIYVLTEDYGELTYSMYNRKYTAYNIFDMFADSTGLWVAGEDAGILHYPFKRNSNLDIKNPNIYNTVTEPSLSGNKITEVCPSKKYPGVIWAGVNEIGIVKIERSGARITNVKKYFAGNTNKTLSNNIIRSVYEDSNGKVWIGTENGLNCFDPETEEFEKFYYSANDTNSLNDNAINAIMEDHSGNLWVGTNSGLNKKIIAQDNDGNSTIKFKGYPDLEYLSNEFISGILADRSGNLWVRLYRGIIQFNLENEEINEVHFSQDFKNERFERNAELLLENGNLLLGNLASVVLMDPNKISNKSVPKVEMTDLKVYNKSIFEDKGLQNKYGINSTIPYVDQIKLSYKDKMVTFIFSAMDFKNPDKNTYYYRLDDFDYQWNIIEGSNSVTYTNIPPGHYTFKVSATNADNPQENEMTTMSLIVTPPWWKSNLAYVIYFVLFIGLLYLYQLLSVIRAKEKHTLAFEKMKSEELQRMNEQKSLFFTDITHELRTPLTLILGPSKALLDDKKLSPESHKQAHLINTSSHKLLRLVNQLLEFRKIEKGIPDSLYIQHCNLAKLLREVYNFFQPLADSRQINYTLNISPDNIMAYFDPDKMEKIIFNLLSNAFKYTPDNSAISIKLFERTTMANSSEVIIEVEDSGVGIAKEYQEKIFERFFQVKGVRTQSTGGIGLFMAKAMIEQHGGSIELDSEVDKGSCFRLVLPVNGELAAKAQKNEKWKPEDSISSLVQPEDSTFDNILHDVSVNGTDSKKPQVLVVEDDTDLKEFLCTGLAKYLKVECAGNGKEALEKIEANIPDLILSDIMMPEMDGFELCRELRNDLNYSHIPVIFLTAKTMQEDHIKGLELGAVDYIYKPFNMASLSLKIYNLLTLQKQKQDRLRTEQLLEPEQIELSSLDEEFLKAAVQSVQNNLDNAGFDVDAFSKELKVSANQAYRKIKALTGQTANEFIRTQRLKVAAGMLVQNKRSISEIIYMVGFTSPSYFSRCFKDFYGCTPKEYIEKNSQN